MVVPRNTGDLNLRDQLAVKNKVLLNKLMHKL
jgi:hypothetical protein